MSIVSLSPSSWSMTDDYPNVVDLNDRLKTFDKWPIDSIDKNLLAESGFYYTGERDMVECFACQVTIERWQPYDDPQSDHARYSPNCVYIKKRSRTTETDLASLYTQSENSTQDKYDKNDTCTQKYSSYKSRIETFWGVWPKHAHVTKAALAEAGFFYTGVGDRVECFHCGGILKNWESGDDPWTEHAFWFSDCDFVLYLKGAEFMVKSRKLKRKMSVTEVKKMCEICGEKEANAFFAECCHVVTCMPCASMLSNCPKCETSVNKSLMREIHFI